MMLSEILKPKFPANKLYGISSLDVEFDIQLDLVCKIKRYFYFESD